MPDAKRLGLVPLQPHKATPVTFIGAPLRTRPRNLCQTLLFPQLGAPLHTLRRLGVLRLGLGGRSAPRRHAQHLELSDDSLQ